MRERRRKREGDRKTNTDKLRDDRKRVRAYSVTEKTDNTR